MSADRYQYTMLMASLPRHPDSLFATRQIPLSRIKLDQRLSLLEKEHTEQLHVVEEVLFWSKLNAASDEQYLQKYRLAMRRLDVPFFRQLVADRLEIRTLIAALRKRNKGEPAPPPNSFSDIVSCHNQICKYWQQADFGLGAKAPWLIEANQLLQEHKSLELEKLILNHIWQQYVRQADFHVFDFAAVVLYVLRWDIIDRWTRYDATKASDRFNQLVTTALQNIKLFEERA